MKKMKLNIIFPGEDGYWTEDIIEKDLETDESQSVLSLSDDSKTS